MAAGAVTTSVEFVGGKKDGERAAYPGPPPVRLNFVHVRPLPPAGAFTLSRAVIPPPDPVDTYVLYQVGVRTRLDELGEPYVATHFCRAYHVDLANSAGFVPPRPLA